MPYAAFDIEIAKDIPDGKPWQEVAPVGITCAALAFSDGRPSRFYKGVPSIPRHGCAAIVQNLEALAKNYTLVTWNGCGFDFAVLAQESGLVEECARGR